MKPYLRKWGHAGHASHAIGGDIHTVPTAQSENLGHNGKNGTLFTPWQGSCVRLAALFLDVEGLP